MRERPVAVAFVVATSSSVFTSGVFINRVEGRGVDERVSVSQGTIDDMVKIWRNIRLY